MAEAAVAVAAPVLDKTVGSIFAIIDRQIGYVCRYSENIENLRRRLDELGIVRGNVESKIERATNNGDIVRENVSGWLKKAEEIEKDAKAFLPGEVKSNIRCLKGLFSFPNIKSRYRLGKEAVKRSENVAELEILGKKLEDAVISDPAPPPGLTYRYGCPDYQEFESRRSIFEEIMTALKDETIQRIGIWGMGGVGKTAMVTKVGDEAKKDHIFDDVVLAVVSQEPKVRGIQEELAPQLKMDRVDNEAEFNITSRLYNRLKKGKNLVILDDVWKKINLNDIGIPSPQDARDCKVLFTSRDRSALEVQKLIPVNILRPEEAWKLFEKKLGDAFDPHDARHDLAKDVCGECGGLPVAIRAIAGALKEDESEDKWEVVLLYLKESKLKYIHKEDGGAHACLEVSYNYLKSEEEKSCFLFCCLFPEDYDISVDSLMRLGRGMGVPEDMTAKPYIVRHRIRSLVNGLKNRCLLLEGKDSEHVKMHDVVRDVAISIGSERHGFLIDKTLQQWTDTKPYDVCSVISLTFDEGFHELSNVSEYPKLHTILLKCKFKSKSPCSPILITDRFFNNMTKLQVLAMQNMEISRLPSSMKFLHGLRVLSLVDCDLDGTSFVGELRKLEMLILQGPQVRVLPTQVGDLTCLRLLDVRNCQKLEIIPPNVLLGLSKLEELFMPWNFKKWGYGAIDDAKESADLTELKALNQLESLEIHVPKFEMLPQHSRFPFWGKLKRFKLSVQTFLYQEESKNVMKLEGVPLTRGLDLLLNRVEALDITRLEGLRDFKLQNGDRESFSKLEDLQADSCEGMQEFLATALERPVLPRPPSWKLGVLIIRRCNLRKLLSPSAAEALVLLRRLTIQDCKNIEAVVGRNDVAPGRSGQAKERVDNIIFPKLEYLNLKDLPDLVSFYPKMNQTTGLEENQDFSAQPLFSDKVAFPELENLEIDNAGECEEIVGLHLPAQESFSKLRVLTVRRMNNFSTIGSSTLIPRLQSLQKLRLWDCGCLRAVFKAERSEISEREERVAIDSEKAATEECFEFPALENLEIIGCRLLEEFWSNECSEWIEEREKITFFHNRIGFPKLRRLTLVGMEKVEEIWMEDRIPPPHPHSFCNLTSLMIYRFPNLKRAISPVILPRLDHLEILEVWKCESVREVIKVVGVGSEEVVGEGHGAFNVLPKLNYISLRDLPNLENLPWETAAAAAGSVSSPHSSFLAFQCLSRILIRRCGRLRNLVSSPSTALAFPAPCNLRGIDIGGCEKMEEIVSGWGWMGKEVAAATSAAASSSSSIAAISNQIIFPRLEYVSLVDLPNLKTLCPPGYLLFQPESSLKRENIVGCPNLTQEHC